MDLYQNLMRPNQAMNDMGKVDEFINWVKGERRNPDIHRSSTVHYPDWDMKKKEYIVPPRQRKESEVK